MTVTIEFTDTSGAIAEEYYPRPASKMMPDWFLKLPAKINLPSDSPDKMLFGTPSAKRCVPMLDAFTAGYIIPTASDIIVSIRDGKYYYQWSNTPEVHFQPIEQLGDYAGLGELYGAIPKIMLPWAIKTPPGYSCLFVPPVNQDNPMLKIFSGVIDTDTFNVPGAFPFLFTGTGFTGLIPAGTPFVQVIPFRREAYRMKIGDSVAGTMESERQHNRLRSVFRNGYRSLFWDKKQYN